jgi:transcriptional regulator with XRE-family HTH domain
MGFLADGSRRPYAHKVPQAKRDSGPWGEAIRYWLNERRWSQSDLARATQLQPKTISRIVRGFHTQTRLLEQIAAALGVALDRVLVSPLHGPHDDRRELLRGIITDTLRSFEFETPIAEETLNLAKRIHKLRPDLRDAAERTVVDFERLKIRRKAVTSKRRTK